MNNVEEINVIENIISAVSILNKTDEYLEGLYDRLSECDSLTSDYEHLIENSNIEEINLTLLFKEMQEVFRQRRKVKDNITLKNNYKNLTAKLNNSANREFLIQNMKNIQSKLGVKYHNRILTDEKIELLKANVISEEKRGRGRPKKE